MFGRFFSIWKTSILNILMPGQGIQHENIKKQVDLTAIKKTKNDWKKQKERCRENNVQNTRNVLSGKNDEDPY